MDARPHIHAQGWCFGGFSGDGSQSRGARHGLCADFGHLFRDGERCDARQIIKRIFVDADDVVAPNVGVCHVGSCRHVSAHLGHLGGKHEVGHLVGIIESTCSHIAHRGRQSHLRNRRAGISPIAHGRKCREFRKVGVGHLCGDKRLSTNAF